LVLGEKIKDPLNHEVRYILLNIILRYKRTGIRLGELSRITGKKNHSLRHHLDILEEKNLVYTKRSTRQLFYYPDSNIPKHTRIGHPLENEFRSELLKAILDSKKGGINVDMLYRKMRVSKNRAMRGLKILKYFDLINLSEDENKTFCYPTPRTLDLVRYVERKTELLKDIKSDDGLLIKDFKNNIDLKSLNFFKLCVYTKRHKRDTFYYLTPFVRNIIEES